MLIPRKVKHRKQHHPGRSGHATGGTKVTFGEFGIQAMTPAYVTNRQIESARIAMTRHIKRRQDVDQHHPDRPLTKKPAETRMGSGKGFAGVVGRERQAGSRPLRGRRRQRELAREP
jgi:large subunit ribosomal protein L16